MRRTEHWPVIIIGGGAAGLMAAAYCGPDTLVIEHGKAPGEKIRISGGGRCNFTNLEIAPERYLSQNPHFAKSALARYTQWDFVAMVSRYSIGWHEKTLGQLFCDDTARDIVSMLLSEMKAAGATLWLGAQAGMIAHRDGRFEMDVTRDGNVVQVSADRVVLATGGKPIPKMGASDYALRVAERFGLAVTETRPALVPLTFSDRRFAEMSGTSAQVVAEAGQGRFQEAALFTHRGISGPAILQISSYWREGEEIILDLLPGQDGFAMLREARKEQPRKSLASVLAQTLPAKLAALLANQQGSPPRMADLSDKRLSDIAQVLSAWRMRPTGSEGYRTAEVMLGGVDTAELSSRSMEAHSVPGLYIIGEAVDVTGWLGGYNFQWAWSSAVAAGTAIASKRGVAVAAHSG